MCSPIAFPVSPVPDIYLICNIKNHKYEPPIVLSTFGVDFETRMLDKILYVLVGNKRYAT
jgi:hypothetical protein